MPIHLILFQRASALLSTNRLRAGSRRHAQLRAVARQGEADGGGGGGPGGGGARQCHEGGSQGPLNLRCCLLVVPSGWEASREEEEWGNVVKVGRRLLAGIAARVFSSRMGGEQGGEECGNAMKVGSCKPCKFLAEDRRHAGQQAHGKPLPICNQSTPPIAPLLCPLCRPQALENGTLSSKQPHCRCCHSP